MRSPQFGKIGFFGNIEAPQYARSTEEAHEKAQILSVNDPTNTYAASCPKGNLTKFRNGKAS